MDKNWVTMSTRYQIVVWAEGEGEITYLTNSVTVHQPLNPNPRATP